MDLSKPAYDSILKWDQKLEQLQSEVKQLEEEYGFSEEHVDFYLEKKKQEQNTKTAKRSTSQSKDGAKGKTKTNLKETRYNRLPEVKVSEKSIPKPVIKPEIDPAWKVANKVKPCLETFYDNQIFMPKYVDEKDFQCKPVFCSDYSNFYSYMGNFGVGYMKQN